MKNRNWMLTPWFLIFGLVMLLMATFMSTYDPLLFYIELGISVLSVAVVIALSISFRGYIRAIVRSTADHIVGFNSQYLDKYKYPVVVSGDKGDIIWCNARFRKTICGGRSPEGDNINAYLYRLRCFKRRGRSGLPLHRQHRLQENLARVPREYALRSAYQL